MRYLIIKSSWDDKVNAGDDIYEVFTDLEEAKESVQENTDELFEVGSDSSKVFIYELKEVASVGKPPVDFRKAKSSDWED